MNPATSAETLRKATWEEGRFPVDPVTIAKKLGLVVLETELPPTVSGALIKEAGKDPVIVVHNADSNNRKRFSCAHELGHYIARAESDEIEQAYEYVDMRNGVSANGTDPEEIAANQFAANLLMPASVVKALHKTKTHVEMALFFGVSNDAMTFRLKNLGLI